MRVLGIDPGTLVVGYGCVERAPVEQATHSRIRNQVSVRNPTLELCGAGAIRLGARGAPLEERLERLADSVAAILERFRPDRLAVEEAFHGKSIQSALRIGECRGVILVCGVRAGVTVAQYPPATIKLRVAGAGGASKDTVARMVALSLGSIVEGMPRDATDALAVALCDLHSNEFGPDRVMKGAGHSG